MATFISDSADETIAAGREFAGICRQGRCVRALTGDLGAGKTRFVKGFVAGIGSTAEVTSPTFILMHEYGGGRLPVYHFDFFRIEDREAIADGWAWTIIFSATAFVSIEWADRHPELIPRQREVALIRTERRKRLA